MQADIVLATILRIKAIQASGRVMTLEDAHFLSKVSQANPCRNTRHARSYNRDIVPFHFKSSASLNTKKWPDAMVGPKLIGY